LEFPVHIAWELYTTNDSTTKKEELNGKKYAEIAVTAMAGTSNLKKEAWI